MRIVVLLPEPFAPRKAKIAPRSTASIERVDGDELAEALA